jgi:hypothetical protein
MAFCLDLAWKLVHWGDFTRGLEWWVIVLALIVRFAVMGFLSFVLLKLRKEPEKSK